MEQPMGKSNHQPSISRNRVKLIFPFLGLIDFYFM